MGFFSGDITLEKAITLEDTAYELVLDRFHLADVRVNGTYAGRMMFSRRLDLSPYLRVGENTVEIILSVGNRNLLGPHHMKGEETIAVGPNSWERLGTWENGKSPAVEPDYAFVKTIL